MDEIGKITLGETAEIRRQFRANKITGIWYYLLTGNRFMFMIIYFTLFNFDLRIFVLET